MTKTPLLVRIRAFFARDKEAFWWDHYTDEEMKLRRMDVWELAAVINEARVRNLAGEAERLIVAEHMLNVRLAKIQASASWGSGVLGFAGAILGAAVSVTLTMLLSEREAPHVLEPANGAQFQVVEVQPLLEPSAEQLYDSQTSVAPDEGDSPSEPNDGASQPEDQQSSEAPP